MELMRERDLIAESHLPVYTFFFALGRRLPEVMPYLCGGGFSYELGSVSFWDTLDEYDRSQTAPFSGALVEDFDGQSVALSCQEWYCYLKTACARYQKLYPESAGPLHRMLDEYRTRRGVGNLCVIPRLRAVFRRLCRNKRKP